MHLLIVDDQEAVTESLEKGIDWKQIGIDHVYTAYSAKEAKLILKNFEIDILLTDIEMPEEDGLSLVEWTINCYPNIICVFLTSHAEFSYAQKAVSMQSFDYILQPARFEEVEQVIKRASKKIRSVQKIKKLQDQENLILRQRNVIMDSMMTKLIQNKEKEVEKIFKYFPEIFQLEYESCVFYPLIIRIVKWNKEDSPWNDNLIMMVIQNVIEELLEYCSGKSCIAYQYHYGYSLLVAADKSALNEEKWIQLLEEFYTFLRRHMDFSVAIYPGGKIKSDIVWAFQNLISVSSVANQADSKGVIWKAAKKAEENENKDVDIVRAAIAYIKENIGKNISRSEVAGLVYLNEEYFSRVFKQQTGCTFKNYVLMEKMNAAKTMLEQTGLSVGIIASKVGFDNFSHFSKMFKKMTDMSPQEFRKENRE